MAIPGNYTPQELIKISGAAMVTGMAVAMVDYGVINTAIEAGALAKEVSGAAKKYPNNQIIQALFSEEAIAQAKTDKPELIQLKAEDMKPDTAVDTATRAINDAMEVLTAKATPEEIKEYKEFIYSCAEAVAGAAGSGLFGSGEKISPTEAAALAKIKVALGI